MLWNPLRNILDGRANNAGCWTAGWMRVAFASLFLIDQLVLYLDYADFFDPVMGLTPFNQVVRSAPEWSIFQYAPESSTLLWNVYYYLGLFPGILLLLGIFPRLACACVLVYLISLRHHSQMFWDGQDDMFRTWAILLLFLPLHHVTVWDWVRPAPKDHSWPIWPFRLFQYNVSAVYLGAAFGKLDGESWIQGWAMFNVVHEEDFFPGIFAPDFLFNRILPLHIMSWSTIVVETACIATAWIPSLRTITLLSVAMLHLGIELAMNMHCFEWLTMTGWASFLVQPDALLPKHQLGMVERCRRFLDAFVFVTMVTLVSCGAIPFDSIYNVSPRVVQRWVNALQEAAEIIHKPVKPWVHYLGLEQYPWDMFCADPDSINCSWQATLKIDDGSSEMWYSPDWINMSRLQRKRHMRWMDFYEHLEEQDYARPLLMRRVAREWEAQHPNRTIVSIILDRICDGAPYYPDIKHKLGWFDKARNPDLLYHEASMVLELVRCVDEVEQCAEWAAQGHCTNTEVRDSCLSSCNICDWDIAFHEYQEKMNSEEDVGSSILEEENRDKEDVRILYLDGMGPPSGGQEHASEEPDSNDPYHEEKTHEDDSHEGDCEVKSSEDEVEMVQSDKEETEQQPFESHAGIDL